MRVASHSVSVNVTVSEWQSVSSRTLPLTLVSATMLARPPWLYHPDTLPLCRGSIRVVIVQNSFSTREYRVTCITTPRLVQQC
jgi:hypothetical protein